LARKSTAIERIPNEVRRERSRNTIMAVSEKLFVEQGYAATTIEHIATASGFTKGAIYFHFKDKSGVLIELINRAEERVIDPLIQAMGDAEVAPEQKVINYLHYWSKIGVEQRNTMFLPILMSLEFNGTDSDIEEHLDRMYERVYSALTPVIEEGHACGTIRKAAPPREQANMLIAMMDGTLLEWLRRGDKVDGPMLTRGIRDLLLHGLIEGETPCSPVTEAPEC